MPSPGGPLLASSARSEFRSGVDVAVDEFEPWDPLFADSMAHGDILSIARNPWSTLRRLIVRT